MRRPTKPPAGLSPSALLRYFRIAGRLIICEHDGSLWATDSYIAARLTDDSPVATLLAAYNLPFEPMVCDVDSTVVRRPAPPPDIGGLIPPAAGLVEVSRYCIGSAPVLIESTPSTHFELWEAEGQRLCLNPVHFGMASLLAPAGRWMATALKASTKPLIRVADDGTPVGIAMPVRNLATLTDESSEAA